MNRLFGAAKKEEPAPAKKEEPKAPEEPPKKASIPLSEQQAKVRNKLFSWKTRSDKFPKQ
jgi:hypothetical protein